MPALQRTTLPHFNDDEIVTFFGRDAAARRRYLALSALLHQGKTQREAAELARISERTVRNTLRAFSRRGVAGLRSQQGATRPRNSSRKLFEQALRSVLHAEPEGGGDRLWRLAQEILGAEGAQLSRRTAYRILADLRAADEDGDAEGDELLGKLRVALPLLAEDPPLALGGSALAQLLLPGDGDVLSRGLLLQSALRIALDRLRPDGQVSTVDRSWWPYLICSGEYEAGQRRADLQQSLSLSASTYSRAKRSGLSRIINLLPTLIAQSSVRSTPQRLPRVDEFAGRAEAQAFYSAQLLSASVTQIWGLAGSGKTALAAEIAAEGRRYGQRVIWHSCQTAADANLPAVLRGLGRALAACGDDSIADELSELKPDDDGASLVMLLCQRLRSQPSLVVIDDIHRCSGDPAIALLLDELRALALRRQVRLLLLGRERLPWVNVPPLAPITAAECQAIWESLGGPLLAAERWDEIQQTVAGLPGLLPLVVSHADESSLRGPWFAALEAWAEAEIWSRVDEPDRRVLALMLAVDCPLPADVPALQQALEASPEQLAALENSGLLLRAGAGLQPHPALRLAMPVVSLAHWQQLQIVLESLGIQGDDSEIDEELLGYESGPGALAPAASHLLGSETVALPADLLQRALDLLQRCSCSAEQPHLQQIALQLTAYLR